MYCRLAANITQHPGLANFNQHAALGVVGKVGRKFDRAKLLVGPLINSGHSGFAPGWLMVKYLPEIQAGFD